jgi:hypothetical protein
MSENKSNKKFDASSRADKVEISRRRLLGSSSVRCKQATAH